MSNVKYCPKCGQPLSLNQTVCPRCGDGVTYMINPAVKTGRNNLTIYIILATLIVIIGILVGIIIVKGDGKTKIRTKEIVKEVLVQPEDTQTTAQQGPSVEARRQSLMSDFEKILRKNPNEYYVVTDLNHNGFPELWITYNVGNHADGRYHVYHGEKGKAREIYSVDGNIISNRGSYVLIGDGNMSVKLTYTGSSINADYADEYPQRDDAVTTRDVSALRNAFNR